MNLLTPNWLEPRPSSGEARLMCETVRLSAVTLEDAVFSDVVTQLRHSHDNGGAHLAVLRVGPQPVFDWFASRNRLNEEDILARLLSRDEVRDALPELKIPVGHLIDTGEQASTSLGFTMESSFLFDGYLSQRMHTGGAYNHATGDGAAEKRLALNFCEVGFGSRFAEILFYSNHLAWSPWFMGIGWDWTAILFDGRLRNLWILAVTDTD